MKENHDEPFDYSLQINYCTSNTQITHDEYLVIKACISLKMHPTEYPLMKYTVLVLDHFQYVTKCHPGLKKDKRFGVVMELLTKIIVSQFNREIISKVICLDKQTLRNYYMLQDNHSLDKYDVPEPGVSG